MKAQDPQDLYEIQYSSPTRYSIYCIDEDMYIRENMAENEAHRLMAVLLSDVNA